MYLTGSAFEEFSDADAVRKEARQRVAECSAIISLEWLEFRPPTVGNVERENANQDRDKYLLAESGEYRIRGGSVGLAEGRSKASAIGEAIGGPPPEPQPTSAQRMLNRASQNQRLQSALRLFYRQPLDPNRLYKIVETIERELGCSAAAAGFCSANQLERFTRSVNSDEVMGEDARHAAGKYVPPKIPMDVGEATGFVRQLLLAVLSGTK